MVGRMNVSKFKLVLLLWMVVLPSMVQGGGQRIPKTWEDDEYHCADWQTNFDNHDDDTVACDPDTYKWDVDRLDPNQKPWRCERWWDGNPEGNSNYYEICVLWERTYGKWKPSSAPTDTQPTASPSYSSLAPTAVASAVPTAVPSLSPAPTTPGPSLTPTSSLIPTTLPTFQPSTSGLPTVASSASPSAAPTAAPSKNPTGSPTITPLPTILPTQGPTLTVPPSLAPTDTPTDSPSAAPSVQISNKLQLTTTAFRVSLVLPVSETSGNQLRRRRQLQEEVNLEEWHQVTHQHLVNQISTTYPALARLDLEFLQDPLKEELSPNVVQVTQAMVATGYFRVSNDPFPTSQQLDQVTLDSFQGTPKFAYLLLLEQSEDATLQQTQQVSVAAAPDVSRAQTGNSDEPTKESEESDYSLYIYIGAGVGALVVVLLGGLFVYRRRQKRLREWDENNKARNIEPSSTGGTSKSGVLFPDLLPDDQERPPPQSQRSTSEEEDDDDDMSAATSMYSYIDNNSLAPKELYHIRERSEKDDASSAGILSVSVVNTSYDSSSAYSSDNWEADSEGPGMQKKKKSLLPDEEDSLYPDDDSILPVERPGSVLLGDSEGSSSQQAQDFSSVWESEGSPEKTKSRQRKQKSSPPKTAKRKNGASARVAEDTRTWEEKYGIPAEETS